MRMVLIVLALILISCKKESEPKLAVKTVDSVNVANDTVQGNEIWQVDSTELFVFTLDMNGLQIVKKSDRNIVQTICDYTGGAPFDVHQDFNFDGYYDLFQMTSTTGDGADFWIYNPKRKIFEQDSVLSNSHCEMMKLDSQHKQIIMATDRACYHFEWTYQFINGKAELVYYKDAKDITDTNPITNEEKSGMLIEHEKRVNGKMKTIISQKVLVESGFGSFNPSDYKPMWESKN